ncbi:hypothetical protein PtA15_2A773 [Puccinia triticina]|uniref:Uncharacterized protein n=1 Tax=Puccinia triticina TaxID=208348 RepID=A0ABY7CB82_9BASI|nr:uncharacterized protein PtA15_2A773 [Puccinia triticina]WAQ82456.1 hypothetical protein PtA15_2A773 [Puccinia triticina]
MYPGHPDYILCEETQNADANSLADEHPAGPQDIDTALEWTKVSSKAWTLPWSAHIQSMHWKEFHDGALAFLSQKCLALLPAMQKANQGKEISWFGSISGHPKYRPPHGFLLQGHLDFLGFGAAAYKAYPADVKFRLIMKDPRKEPSVLKYAWTLSEDAHNIVITGGPRMLLTETYKRCLASVANSRDSWDMDELASTDNESNDPSKGHVAKHPQNYVHTPTNNSSDIEFVDLPKRLFLPEENPAPNHLEEETNLKCPVKNLRVAVTIVFDQEIDVSNDFDQEVSTVL